ncbi:MAG: oleate hydratase [Pelovirga sp.]
MKNNSPTRGKYYIVGAGIAGLATAVYLIRDGGCRGTSISIFDAAPLGGGALDGSGSAQEGYLIRGGHMLEEHFGCTWDLLATIPSVDNPARTVKEEIFVFNRQVVSNSRARLLKGGKKIDVSSYGLSRHDIIDLLRLTMSPEESLAKKRIDDFFTSEFFDTPFWQLWSTTFAFQRWSSVAEMRRYAIRFIHLLPGFNRLEGIMRTLYNQYDSVVLPLTAWLKEQGVNFVMNSAVTDVDFAISASVKRATALHFREAEAHQAITLGADDRLFITLGSIVESSATGSMTAPAPLLPKSPAGAWRLWERIAIKDSSFGQPQVFCGSPDKSKWMSFTVTLTDPTFFRHMENFTGNRPGTGGLVSFTDSNWLMSVVLAHQPHFRNQPTDVNVFWGDGLRPDAPGNFVAKPMTDCSGAEILAELFAHLGITEMMLPLQDRINCVPCMMPYIDSEFMPRAPGDRPAVIPRGAVNFAFLGQFVEIPHDCVFTVEYSVRSAQMAVFGLLNLSRPVTPVYRGDHDISVLLKALKALRREPEPGATAETAAKT